MPSADLELGTIERQLIKLALEEDLGPEVAPNSATIAAPIAAMRGGDVTSNATIPENEMGEARFIAREPLRVCGLAVAQAVFESCATPGLPWSFKCIAKDGDEVENNAPLAIVCGSVRTLLTGERTALNFLQRLSGIATQTARLVKSIEGTGAALLDTRKTTPGFRLLEKYAVRIGGGLNHRAGLYDMFLIKNNHVDAIVRENVRGNKPAGAITAAEAVGKAIQRCRTYRDERNLSLKIEAEVRDEAELRAALQSQADIVLLDNMSPAAVRQAVQLRHTMGLRENVKFEASGGITADNLREYAETGVDFLSMGALTHSVKSADISLRISFRA